MNENEKSRAAYALNLCKVSVKQIIDYNDVYFMKQEYDNILNNLNLENMPKDDALLDAYKTILDTINSFLKVKGDFGVIEKEYKFRMKNAIWSALPALGGVYFSGDGVLNIALSLATQIGTGYMNYRRVRANIENDYARRKWELTKLQMDQLNSMHKSLFETAWKLAETYGFPDEYRLSDEQIDKYSRALMESDELKRYGQLKSMKDNFRAYPPFWYELGSTVSRLSKMDAAVEVVEKYRKEAIGYFEEYKKINQQRLLRKDILTSEWALEYCEILDLNSKEDIEKAKELVKIAENSSGRSLDVLEMCAFRYLLLQDYHSSIRIFDELISYRYNEDLNAPILSCLYIINMRSNDGETAKNAKIGYEELKLKTEKEYIVEIPKEPFDIKEWEAEWNDRDLREERYRIEKIKMCARPFYERPVIVVFNARTAEIADYMLKVLTTYRDMIDESLPQPEKLSVKDYERKIDEYDRNGDRIIILGGSAEKRKFFSNMTENNDESEFGYMIDGTKILIKKNRVNIKKMESEEYKKLYDEFENYDFVIPEELSKEKFELEYFDPKGNFIKEEYAWAPYVLASKRSGGNKNKNEKSNMLKLESVLYVYELYRYLDNENALIK